MKGITQRVAFCDWLLNRAFPTFPRSIRVVCVSGLHSFTWPGNIPFYKYSSLLTCSSADGNLGCLLFLAGMNPAAVSFRE